MQAAPIGIMAPAYFYPGPLWNSLSNAAKQAPLIAIMNPNNGPDTSQNSDYVAAVNGVRSAGGKVTGYVYTSYGARLLTQVETDIDRYLTFYNVDGFFVDEMTNDSDTNHLNYYATLFQYIKTKDAKLSITGNPGTNTREEYLARPATEAVVIFEDGTGYDSFIPSSWVTNHLARQFVHLAYNVTNASTMSNYVSLAVSRNAGWVYVTNDKLSNPWDTLPSYWTNEVNFIQVLNQAAPPTHISVTGITNQIPSLQISGAPGTYELQAAPNLSDWFPVQNVNMPTSPATLNDFTASNTNLRFYRTRQ
jgi:hypothetical protein